MVSGIYTVLENYDPKKKYKINVQAKACSILSLLKKGDVFTPKEFSQRADTQMKLNGIKTQRDRKTTVFRILKIGRDIGILKREAVGAHNIISFDDFCQIEEVQEWIELLNPPNVKNIKQDKYAGTRGSYANKLHLFHCWLIEQPDFEVTRLVRVNENSFNEIKTKIKIEGVPHLLSLYQERGSEPREFKKIIKKYIHHKMHEEKFKSTMNQTACSIRSFFAKHDSPIDFNYNKNLFKQADKEDEDNEPSMNLDEFLQLLTQGKPSVMEKSIFMTKFQGGMDSLTLADRFNFYGFAKISKYFGSEDPNSWDLAKCPVPIKITRPKTNVTAMIMQDYDAIKCLQVWLKQREKKTGKAITSGDPIYINKRGNPITETWIEKAFFHLADVAELQKKVKGYQKAYMKKSHLVRDLLESTLVDCGVPDYVAEQFISHAVISKYQKRRQLYPEGLINEYKKASKKVNIFSRVSQSLTESQTKENLTRQLSDLDFKSRQDMGTMKSKFSSELEEIKRKQANETERLNHALEYLMKKEKERESKE